MSVYEKLGYKDRADYLEFLSGNLEIDIDTVYALAELLGPTEDFDGLVSSLEDM
jgi:hypothetical protein